MRTFPSITGKTYGSFWSLSCKRGAAVRVEGTVAVHWFEHPAPRFVLILVEIHSLEDSRSHRGALIFCVLSHRPARLTHWAKTMDREL